MKSYYMDHAFWRSPDRKSATAILITEHDDGKKTSRQVDLDEILPNGNRCPMFQDLVNQLGIDLIDKNTEERRIRKEAETQKDKIISQQREKSAKFEELFTLKIKAFDIEEVRNSKNKTLRAKLRRAKNEVELNAYVTLLIMEALNNGEE